MRYKNFVQNFVSNFTSISRIFIFFPSNKVAKYHDDDMVGSNSNVGYLDACRELDWTEARYAGVVVVEY